MSAVDTNIVVRLLTQDDEPQYLLGLPNVYVNNATLLAQVLQWHEAGLDFADALHLAQSQQCSAFYTLDNRFISRSIGLGKCPVRRP